MSFGANSDSSALDATTTNMSFTISQWKELQRQVCIFNYLAASLPVPPELLKLDFSSDQNSSSRNKSKIDSEEGRCRRTDGKKWRCSREVAPDNNKYCVKHMYRGSSRKHVEVHNDDNIDNEVAPFSVSNVTVAMPNPSTMKYGGSSSHFHPYSAFYPYHQSFLSLDNNGFAIKAPSSDFSNWQQRCLEWMMLNGAYNLGWYSLMHDNNFGMTNESFYQNNNESHFLNSFPVYTTSELPPQEKPFSPEYNSVTVPMKTLQYEKPRDFYFIDGCSNAETVENNVNTNDNVSDTSIDNLYDSSLDLSMGGPLAEVLRPIKITSISDATNSIPSSPVGTNHVESFGTEGT